MSAIHLLHPWGEVGGVPRRVPAHRRGRPAGHRLRASLRARLREWQRRARERAELAALDDRSLRDIGLTRGEAAFLASKPFWRK